MEYTQDSYIYTWCKANQVSNSLLPQQILSDQKLEEKIQQKDLPLQFGTYQLSLDTKIQGIFILLQEYIENPNAQIGWMITQDITRHAVSHMIFKSLELAFSNQNLHRLTWDIVENEALNIEVYSKFGFVLEGKFREYFYDGRYRRNIIRLGLLRSDWAIAQNALKTHFEHYISYSNNLSTYSIQILTDSGSWITPYINELAEEWESLGNLIQVGHKVEHLKPADFCFCLSSSQIVSAATRSQYKHTLVVHESDLPAGRGWAPMAWQIIEGKNRIAVTLFEAVDAVDAGPIYLQTWIDLTGTELHEEWRVLQAQATQQLCRQWLHNYPAVVSTAREQAGIGTTYARRTPADSRLDPLKSLAEQFDLLRVVDNKRYPAFFDMHGRRYLIKIEPSIK